MLFLFECSMKSLKAFAKGFLMTSKSKKDDNVFLIPLALSEGVLGDDSVVRNAAILGSTSVNASGGIRRRYTDECLSKAVPIFEGLPAYVDHPEPGKVHMHRSLKDMYGYYCNVRADLAEHKLRGDLVLFENAVGQHVKAIIQKNPLLVGNSIFAAGKGRFAQGVEIVEEILPRTKWGTRPSVDLVGNPATTRSLFEHRDNIDDNRESIMSELQNLTLTELREARPDLHKKMIIEGQETSAAEIKQLKEQISSLETAKQDLEKQVKTLTEQVDAVKKEKEAASNKASVEKLLAESKLPTHAVTDAFKNTLFAVVERKDGDKTITIEEQVKALIEDRRLIAGAAPRGVRDNGERLPSDDKGKVSTTEVLSSLQEYRN